MVLSLDEEPAIRPKTPLPIETDGRKDVINKFQYLQWQEIYEKERPYQILLDMPEDSPEQRRHNLVFHEGGEEIIHDVRGQVSKYNLDDNGFQYVKHISKMAPSDFSSRSSIEQTYLPELEEKLKSALNGVDRVYIYDWRKRQTGDHPLHNKEIDFNDKISPLGPARQIHLDQSPASVVQRVLQFLPEDADYLLQGRVRLMNLWQPINGPVEQWPLAICDGSTLPESQLVECDRIRRAYLGCTMYILHTEGIRWYYLSGQKNEDLLLFKTFDSDSEVAARCKYISIISASKEWVIE